MSRERAVFLLSLVLAAILGLGMGWWLRGHAEEPLESRARRAAEHVRDAFRSVTR